MPLLVVLDTNVVLDWFVFRNPGVRAIALAIESGSLRWLCCPQIRAELAHVLANAALKVTITDSEQVLTSFDELSQSIDLPNLLPAMRARCSDASDQMFIDLALAHKARWLLTRDRALLKLARKAAAHGLCIVVPEAWQPEPWPQPSG